MRIEQRLQQGLELLNAGRIASARACANEVLKAEPDTPNAHFLLGLISQRSGDSDSALKAFSEVTRLQPKFAPGWAHLADEQARAGNYDAAVDAIAEAIRHDDGNPIVQQLIGLVQSALNDHASALIWHEKASAADPNNPGFLLNLATCQLYVGQLEAAESSLRALLARQPGHANAHWLLAGLKKAENTNHIEEMDELIATGRFRGPGLALLQYARGKEFEDLSDWDKAFDAFQAGAKARRSSIEYDEPAEIALFDALGATCTPEWLAKGEGEASSAPIFIVGQPRTGTTLVERILSAHSGIHSAGELRQFASCLARVAGHAYDSALSAEVIGAARDIDPRILGAAYLDSVRHFRGSSDHFVDKRPVNYLLVPFILKALPNARVIHLTRGPMDTCFSVFKQLFTTAYPHSYELTEMARHFVRYHGLMKLWRERFGERFISLSYEGVTADFETTAKDLIRYAGVEWQDACGAFDEQSSPVATASAVQVRESVHTRSIGRWREYGDRLQPVVTILEDAGIPLEF